jgi:predicted RNA binding protein YcfA (HicA-like mRNA interferase family)
MSRLPTLTAKQIVAALKQAGFQEQRQSGSHLQLWHPTKRLLTTVPIHPGDIKRSLVKAILKQTRLTEAAFRKLL